MASTVRLLPVVVLAALAAALPVAADLKSGTAKRLFADRVLSNPGYDLHVFSNMPRQWVMDNVIRHPETVASNRAPELALRLKPLHTLEELGGAEAVSPNLLPYDPLKKAQTIIVLDSSQLTDAQRASLAQLRRDLFPEVPVTDDTQVYWIGQNGGGTKQRATTKGAEETFQVLVVAPHEKLLRDLLDELWIWPGPDASAHNRKCPNGQPNDYVMKGTGRFYFVAHDRDVRRVSAATNDPTVRDAIAACFSQPFALPLITRVDPGAPDELTPFLDDKTAHLKLVALNFNGEQELPADFCRRLLPAAMVDAAVARPADTRGLDGWQQFGRQITLQRGAEPGGIPTGYVLAPTARHAIALLRQEYDARAAEAPRLPAQLGDFAGVKKLAVAPYFASRTVPRERLVEQSRLEEMVRERLDLLGLQVVSSPDLDAVLAVALTPGAAMPFSDDGRQRLMTATGAEALLVLYARELTAGERSTVAPLNRRAPEAMGPFDEDEPDKPDRDDYKNPEKYQEALERWRYKHARWEHQQEEWEQKRDELRVTWYFEETRFPVAALAGDLRLVDLAANRAAWSARLVENGSGGAIARRTLERTVTGDETACPPPPAGAAPTSGWTEPALPVARGCLERSLDRGLTAFIIENVFPADIKPWNAPRPDGVPTGRPVTSQRYTITLMDGTSRTGSLLLEQKLTIIAKRGGERVFTPDELEQIEEITNGAAGAQIRLPGEVFSGTIASPALAIRVGEGDQALDWKQITRLAPAGGRVPAVRPLLGFELTDGTKRNGVFAADAIPVAKWSEPLRSADIRALRFSAAGVATITFVDGEMQTGAFAHEQVKVQWAGDAQPSDLLWSRVKSVGEPFGPAPNVP